MPAIPMLISYLSFDDPNFCREIYELLRHQYGWSLPFPPDRTRPPQLLTLGIRRRERAALFNAPSTRFDIDNAG